VLGGTSDIKPHVNNSKVAVVAPLDARGLIVAARGLGTALITIRDVGLATPASATALVGLFHILQSATSSSQISKLCPLLQAETLHVLGFSFKEHIFFALAIFSFGCLDIS
jgi:hypothetical protein